MTSEVPTTSETTEPIPVPPYTTSMNIFTTHTRTFNSPETENTGTVAVTTTPSNVPSSTNGILSGDGPNPAQLQERRALEAIMKSRRLKRVLDSVSQLCKMYTALIGRYCCKFIAHYIIAHRLVLHANSRSKTLHSRAQTSLMFTKSYNHASTS